MRNDINRLIFLCLFTLCLPWLSRAAAGDQKGGFKTSLNLGFSLTDGNSETMLGNLSLDTRGKLDPLGELRGGVEAAYGENVVRQEVDGVSRRSREANVENARVFANLRGNLSPRFFAYADGSALYDGIADIDYRVVAGPGLGVRVIKAEATSLSLEAGVSYLWEEVGNQTGDYLAARLSQRFEHEPGDTSRIWQAAELLPKASDLSDFILNAEAGVEAAVNSRIKLRLTLKNKYDRTPGAGLKRNDLALVSSIGISI